MSQKRNCYDFLLTWQPGGYVKGEKWTFRVVSRRMFIACVLTGIITLPLTLLLAFGAETSLFVTSVKAWHVYSVCYLFCLLVVFFVPYFSRNAHWKNAQF